MTPGLDDVARQGAALQAMSGAQRAAGGSALSQAAAQRGGGARPSPGLTAMVREEEEEVEKRALGHASAARASEAVLEADGQRAADNAPSGRRGRQGRGGEVAAVEAAEATRHRERWWWWWFRPGRVGR